MVGVIVYKLLVYRPLASNPSTRARAQQIANITGAFVNLTIIMILSRVGTVYHILLVTVFISLKSISNGGQYIGGKVPKWKTVRENLTAVRGAQRYIPWHDIEIQ